MKKRPVSPSLSLCLACNCMSKTIKGVCGKCGAVKEPKVDNKWVDEKRKEFENKFSLPPIIESPTAGIGYVPERRWTLSDHEKVWGFIETVITQTQQETLEWCLKEVVGKDDVVTAFFRRYNKFPETEQVEDCIKNCFYPLARNKLRAKMRQTIKQRMEEL